jgi:hypothetical protein
MQLRTLRSLYSDALITVAFRGAPNLTERRRALALVWQTLPSLDAGYKGIIELYWLDLPPVIEVLSEGAGGTQA